MVSYADFLTLMFAVFVVLYSFAMTKQSEVRSMAEAIANAFNESLISSTSGVLLVPGSLAQELNNQATTQSQQNQPGEGAKEVVENGGMIMNFMSNTIQSAEDDETDLDYDNKDSTDRGDSFADANRSSSVPSSENPNGGSDSGEGGLTPGASADAIAEGGRTQVDTENKGEGEAGYPFDAIRKSISDTLTDAEKKMVDIEQDEHWLTININSGMLFAEGSASILSTSRPLIARIAIVVGAINNFVRVRGYTDNSFIPNGIYRNSWNLSAQRSVNVLEELISDGILPERLAVEAYGEYSPFVSNETAAGRALNRRVVIAISRYAMARPKLDVVENDETGASKVEDNSAHAGEGSLDISHGDDNKVHLNF